MRQIQSIEDLPEVKFFMFGQRKLRDGEIIKCLFECVSKKQARELANLCGRARDFRKCAPVSKAPNLSEEARTFFYAQSEVDQILEQGFVPKVNNEAIKDEC